MDIPTRVELGVGERWSVRLPGLGSAGYQWSWELEQGTGVVEVTLTPISSPPMPAAGREPPSTSNVDDLVEVHGLRPGVAIIRLAQRRPWQSDQPALRQYVIEVAVVANDQA